MEPKPDPDALLAVAGPANLAEALGGGEPNAAREHRNLMLDAVREAQRQDVADMLEDEHLDFEEDEDFGVRGAARPPAGQRPAAKTRHRFDPDDPSQAAAPRRVIIERDRRRGRPVGRSAADPPH